MRLFGLRNDHAEDVHRADANRLGKKKNGIFVKLMRKASLWWKNWSDFKAQHSTLFRGENWSKIEILYLNSQARFGNYRMKLIVKMFREIFKVLNQYAVDSPTLPVNQFFLPTSSRSWWNAKPFSGNAEPQQWAAKYLGHTWHIGKRFLQIQRRLLQHLIRKSRIHGSLMYQNTHHHMWWVKAKHQLRIRDASQDRQPEIQSSLVREDKQRIMEQTNNDCRFQILILTNSPRQQRSVVGRKDSRLRYVLVHNFLRKLCCGSKKWSWLIQWMI